MEDTDLQKLTVKELKELLFARDLPTDGKKQGHSRLHHSHTLETLSVSSRDFSQGSPRDMPTHANNFSLSPHPFLQHPPPSAYQR